MQLLTAALIMSALQSGSPLDARSQQSDLYTDPAVLFVEVGREEALDELAVQIEELQVRFESDSAFIMESDFQGLFIKLDSLNIPAESSLYQRWAMLRKRCRDFYAEFINQTYLRTTDFLPIEDDLVDSLEVIPEADTTRLFNLDSLVALHDQLPGIVIVRNAAVESALTYFTTRARKVVQIWLDRASEMVPRLLPIIKEHGMPEELVALAMIESGFNTKAYSWAHAAGPWQFISATGRRYGLKIDWWYDERRDPEKSTVAAMAYLRELYTMFGDWELAMAAYNCGEMRVLRHVRNYGADFWKLNRLPRQTRNYVPSFMAAAIIWSDPAAFGFQPPVFKRPTEFETVKIKECVDVKALAECADADEEAIKHLNPSLSRWCTPPYTEVDVRLPVGAVAGGFWDRYASLPPEKKVSYIRHVVRSGETLSQISKRYGIPMSNIMRHPANKLRNPNRLSLGQVLIIPGGGGGGVNAPEEYDAVEEYSDKRVHVVRRGETLGGIAAKYGISLNRLRSMNGLGSSNLIHPGKRLVITGVAPSQPASKSKSLASAGGSYTVQKGDSLWKIAQQHGVTVEALRRVNDLRARSILRPGQRLTIPESN